MICESPQVLTIKDAEIEKRVAGGRTPGEGGMENRMLHLDKQNKMCWLVDWLVC